MKKILPVLDIGSGRNPFLFRYPDALTINHPNAALHYLTASGYRNPCYPADAHVYLDARDGISFDANSVERVLMHYVIGSSNHAVISGQDCWKLFRSIYLALVPGGFLYIRSVFRHHYASGIDVKPFCSALLSSGFDLKHIDIVPARHEDADYFCKEVVSESAFQEGIPDSFPDRSSFLIAHKPI